MDIDAIIAAGVSAPAENAQPRADAAEEATTETPEGESTEPEAGNEPKEEMFPKKAVNALSRRDKKIGKQAAELAQLRHELEALRKAQPSESQAKETEPQEADFETYGQYLKAIARYEAKNLVSETKKEDSEQKAQSAEKEWEAERAEAIDENADQAKAAFPDFKKVLDSASDDKGIIQLSPHVRKTLLEADNGAFALYVLAKEGLLDEVNAMSPARAAMTIARMEDKGLALSKQKPVTQAPAPMIPAKGVATGSKPAERMSGKELLREIRAG